MDGGEATSTPKRVLKRSKLTISYILVIHCRHVNQRHTAQMQSIVLIPTTRHMRNCELCRTERLQAISLGLIGGFPLSAHVAVAILLAYSHGDARREGGIFHAVPPSHVIKLLCD